MRGFVRIGGFDEELPRYCRNFTVLLLDLDGLR